MSQQCITPPICSESLQKVQLENSELRKYLTAQKSVIASLELRAGRSLESLGVHLNQLTATIQNHAEKQSWNTHLGSVRNEVNCLCDLISDTMLLQKLEAGKIAVKCESLDLAHLLTTISRHLAEPRKSQPIRLVRKIDPKLPLALADQDLTEAVVSDLLARALKYSDTHCSVLLESERVGERVHIRVTAQRFAPASDRSFATEIILCCRRIEVQNGEVTCQHHTDGLQTVTISLPAIP